MNLTQRKQSLVLAVSVLAVMLVAPSWMFGHDAESGSESISELRRLAEQGHAVAQLAPGGAYALIQRSHVIYGPTGAAQRRLAVSPLLSGHRRGVAVSLGF